MNLQRLRDQYKAENNIQACEHCGGNLTIENTMFFKSEICENCFEHIKITDISDCCNAPNPKLVKYIISNGTIQVRNQCSNCGFLHPNSIGGLTKEERECLPGYDISLANKCYDNKYYLKKQISNSAYSKKKEVLKQRWFKNYNTYLNSPEWQTKRLSVLKRDNYLCQSCLDAYATQVHHKSYEFVDMNGSEPAFDLVAICVPCHERIEQIKNSKKIS